MSVVRHLLARLRQQAGMSVLETMVAAVILSAGVLGVFVMVEVSDKVNRSNRGRETANSLAREVLETARATPFQTIGAANWFNQTLTDLEGRNASVVSPSTHAVTTTVSRRGFTYSIEVDTCSVDDVQDGYGSHSGSINWCSDTTGSGSDGKPEDLKRVAVTLSWSEGTKTFSVYQTAMFSSTGQVVGPTLSSLNITAPAGVDQVAPVITSGSSVTFQGIATGAADMKFTVDGVEQTSGVSGGNGTWNFNWNVAPLKDGVYTIGAIAVDALGTRGAPMLKQVTLARGAASPVTNVTGGYNDVFESGVTKRVVELGWDASPEGSVTGYEVWNGATQVCSASLYLECMDLSPASSGSTVYTIKTLYTDAAGNPGSVSTDYTLNAPASGAGSGDFWFSNSTSISQTKCIVPYGGAKNTGPGTRKDLPATNPSGTEATWTNAANGNAIWGCMPPFSTATTMPAQANGMVVSGYFRNTLTTATVCKVGVLVYRYPENLNPLISAANGGAGDFVIPANTQTPTQFTTNYTTPSANLAAGDQLTVFVGGFSASGTNGNDCRGTTMYYNSTARPLKVTMPFGGSGGSSTLQKPSTPTGLTVTANADGTRTVQWTRPASSTPAVEYYRIYRDGQNYTERYDTLGEPGSGTLQYVDTNTGGTSHTYRVTSVAATMAESTQLGPVSG